jgi:serine/threonine protein kinase
VKLLDFGVSKMMREFQNGEDFDLTRTGMVMGTPYYMSPEQARGERNLDGRVDVYACGVVMYEAIAGKRPFVAPNYNALLLAIINTSAKPLRELRPKTPPELEAIVAHAMAKNRDERYQSAKLLLRDLAPPVPAAEGSGARLPAPPTAEERMRAQILGGGRPRPDTGRGRSDDRALEQDRSEAAGAALKSRMIDPGGRMGERVAPSSFDATMRGGRTGLRPPHPIESSADSDDFDIPIHITGPTDYDEPPPPEDPTEVFQPAKHARHAPPPRRPAREPRAPESQNTRTEPSHHSPAVEVDNEWENDTVVSHPGRRARGDRPDRRSLESSDTVIKPPEGMPAPPGRRRNYESGDTVVKPPDGVPPPPDRRSDRRLFESDDTLMLDSKSDLEIVDENTDKDHQRPSERHLPRRRR